ncbi:hypothetical protein L3V79_02505 [Thiotrichales bacterium 19S9-12]|nr:hypothetical protein [Thiotrichales bacterium 19S9-11]MCF6811229.1 hypothetical protein [Thiotrichales bacterium 19S9-12]
MPGTKDKKFCLALDLDETLFTCRISCIGKKVPVTYLQKDYYGDQRDFYVINLEKIKRILKDWIETGGEIAFVTAGDFTEVEMEKLLDEVFGIRGKPFDFYNKTRNEHERKKPALRALSKKYQLVFVDNDEDNIDNAKELKNKESCPIFPIYADTNYYFDKYENCRVNESGTQYVYDLQEIIKEFKKGPDNLNGYFQNHHTKSLGVSFQENITEEDIRTLLSNTKNKAKGPLGGETVEYNGIIYQKVPEHVASFVNSYKQGYLMSPVKKHFTNAAQQPPGFFSQVFGGRDSQIQTMYEDPKQLFSNEKKKKSSIFSYG